MPGTSEAEIAALRTAGDAEFERAFLNMMIAHQDDAVQLARMETSTGVNASARDLADRIDHSRPPRSPRCSRSSTPQDPRDNDLRRLFRNWAACRDSDHGVGH